MRFTILGLVALCACGCEPDSDPNVPREYVLVPSGGRITHDGKPLAGASVTFMQLDSTIGTICSADTDEDDELSYRAEPGAAAADYKVAISYKIGRKGQPLGLKDRLNITRESGAHLATEQIPLESSNLGKMTLKATIPPQGGQVKFDLKGPFIPPKPMEPLEPEAGSAAAPLG